jgi:hypothetical protein
MTMRAARAVAARLLWHRAADARPGPPDLDRGAPMRLPFSLAVAALLAAAAQGADAQAPSAAYDGHELSGFYAGMQASPAATCAPRPLPPPIAAADPTEYVPGHALVAESRAGWSRVRVARSRTSVSGSDLTIVASDSLERDAAPPIAGTVRPDGRFTQRRAIPMGLEGGPREGGRRFFVEQQVSGDGRFERTVGEPGMRVTGAFALVFREGSADGRVFTTCTRPFTLTATRVAP